MVCIYKQRVAPARLLQEAYAVEEEGASFNDALRR